MDPKRASKEMKTKINISEKKGRNTRYLQEKCAGWHLCRNRNEGEKLAPGNPLIDRSSNVQKQMGENFWGEHLEKGKKATLSRITVMKILETLQQLCSY